MLCQVALSSLFLSFFLGIGVMLMAGDVVLTQVTRDGENAPMRLRVLDAGGEEVSAKEGNLVEFGFT